MGEVLVSVAGRQPQLDGLRLVCCLAVVVGHTAWGPILGRAASFGVDVFFALSGFLITRILLREHAATGRLDLRAFWSRRARRIGPVYYLALVVAFGATAALGQAFARPFRGPDDARFFSSTLASYALMAGNLTAAPVPSPVEVLWSVNVEEQFYLVFPVLLGLFAARRRPVWPVALAGLAAAWACRVHLASVDDHDAYRNPLAHADGLLAGALLAQAQAAWPGALERWVAARAWWLEALTVAAAVAHVTWRTGSWSPLACWISGLLSAVLGGALVGALALGHGPLARLLARPSLARLGPLTYAGYVVHMYAVTAAHGLCRGPGPLALAARLVLATALTLALAYAVHRCVERPLGGVRRPDREVS